MVKDKQKIPVYLAGAQYDMTNFPVAKIPGLNTHQYGLLTVEAKGSMFRQQVADPVSGNYVETTIIENIDPAIMNVEQNARFLGPILGHSIGAIVVQDNSHIGKLENMASRVNVELDIKDIKI